MSKQAWSEAVKTNNLEEHMLLDPLYYSFGDKEQKCCGGANKCWGGAKHVGGGGGCTNEVGGVRTPPENPPVLIKSIFMFITDIYTVGMWLEIMQPDLGKS